MEDKRYYKVAAGPLLLSPSFLQPPFKKIQEVSTVVATMIDFIPVY